MREVKNNVFYAPHPANSRISRLGSKRKNGCSRDEYGSVSACIHQPAQVKSQSRGSKRKKNCRMRLPFQEKEPEPKSLWSNGSNSSRNKKAPAKGRSLWVAPKSTSSRQLSTGRLSQNKVTPAPKKKSTSSSQNKRVWPAPQPPAPQKQKEKPAPPKKSASNSRRNPPPAQSQTRALATIGIRKPSRRNKSFVDRMEEAICRWCESVENSGLYYCSAYPVNWIMGNNRPKRRRVLVPAY